eukprot:gene6729-3401_t
MTVNLATWKFAFGWRQYFTLESFKKRRHEEETCDDSEGESVETPATSDRSAPRPMIKDWFQARAARTTISSDSKKIKTTKRLQVSKAGVTTLINRTYIVIKHIGSGTYGQVKLAFNLRDKKLYAIKACRKSQICVSQGLGRLVSMAVA